MKKIILILAISMSLFACESAADKSEKTAQYNIKFYSKVWDEVINDGKVSVLDTAYAPNVVLHTVPEIKGVANAKAYYANYVTGFSNREFTVKETFAQGNKLTKYWKLREHILAISSVFQLRVRKLMWKDVPLPPLLMEKLQRKEISLIITNF